MPVVLLVFGVIVALLTLPGLLPARHWAILFPWFFVAFLGTGLSEWWMVAVAGFTVVLVLLGGLGSWAGWLGLALVLVALATIVWSLLRASKAATEFDRVLAARVAARPRARRAPRSRLLPWSMRDVDVERVKDLRYAEGAGRRHLLDVYRAAVPRLGLSPVVLQIHGGGWTIGAKDHQGRPLMNQLARAGFVCVAINYRLSPRGRWPDHLVDCKAALAWVHEHIHEYGGDPSRVVVTGGSAGGQLAAMVALTQNDPAYQPDFTDADTSVSAVIPMYGAYDLVETYTGFRSRIGRRLGGWFGAHVLGTTPEQDRRAYVDASPINHVRPDVCDLPFLIVHGTHDNLVPVEQARRFVGRLREMGADVTYIELEGAPHAFDVFHSTWEHASTTGIEWWLSSVLPIDVPNAPEAVSPGSSDAAPARSAAGDGSASGPTTMARTAPS